MNFIEKLLCPVHGTWKIKISTTPEESTIGFIVIRKKLDKFHITLLTENSKAHSLSSVIWVSEPISPIIFKLHSIYFSEPTNNNNAIQRHYGALMLNIIPSDCYLSGEFWTNHKTCGDIKSVDYNKKIYSTYYND